MSQFYTSTDHFALLPAIVLALFGCSVLLLDFLIARGRGSRVWILVLSLVGVGFTARALWIQQQALTSSGLGRIDAFAGGLAIDGFALFFNWIFLAATTVVLLISYRFLEIEDQHDGEYYGLLLLANCGMFFLATATDLVTIFVGLELVALCFYILVGFLRARRRSNEAAIKYFLLGGFSSGFLAYGFSLLYGLSGSTNLAEVAAAVSARPLSDPLLILALSTTAVGLLFKISAVPFHMWAPDAYEGAPTTITAYLSVGSKAASFAILLRVFLEPLESTRAAWAPALAAVAVLTMTVGNLAALSQTNVKRLIAYSSISHAGYMLLGLVAGNETGLQGIAVYILVYTFTNLGALLVVVALRDENLSDLSGLARRHPAWAALMVVFLLSLAGMPPTAGFLGKYYIFLALVETGHWLLAVLATLYVAVSLYYYFRIVRSMYAGEPSQSVLTSSTGLRAALAVTAGLTLGIGLYPEPFLRFTEMTLAR